MGGGDITIHAYTTSTRCACRCVHNRNDMGRPPPSLPPTTNRVRMAQAQQSLVCSAGVTLLATLCAHRWRGCLARVGRPSRQSALSRSSYSVVSRSWRGRASSNGSGPRLHWMTVDASTASNSWREIPNIKRGTCLNALLGRGGIIPRHSNRSSIKQVSQSSASTSPTESIINGLMGNGLSGVAYIAQKATTVPM